MPTLPFVQQNNNVFNLNATFMAQLEELDKSCGYAEYRDKYMTFPPSGLQPPTFFNYSSETDLACDVFDMVIFGGTGDLAYRKLLPALYQRFADEQIRPGSRIVGTARDGIDDAEYRRRVTDALGRAGVAQDGEVTKKFLEIVHFRPTDATSLATAEAPRSGAKISA